MSLIKRFFLFLFTFQSSNATEAINLRDSILSVIEKHEDSMINVEIEISKMQQVIDRAPTSSTTPEAILLLSQLEQLLVLNKKELILNKAIARVKLANLDLIISNG